MGESRDIIRERMLGNLNSSYDKLPGTFTWETYQAEAIELENLQLNQEDGTNQAFAGTADLEHLKVMAFEDRGIVYRDAAKATGTVKVTGTAGATIATGNLFASELQQYAATETITLDSSGMATVKVECTTAGSIGNTPVNTIIYFPVTLIGINAVTNESAITTGYDEEGRDALLQRYYLQIQQPATSGNDNHYIQWATEVTGVGAVKVKPLWNGGGTVKVVILDSNKAVAAQQLITDVATYIETKRPIGAGVTVATAVELPVNIACKITLKSGYTLQQVTADITTNITKYFKDNVFLDNTIYYAQVGNAIFDTLGVANIDYSTFTMNSAKNDIVLTDSNALTQIAKVGTVNITV